MPTPLSSPGVFNVLDPWVEYMGSYVAMVANDPTQGLRNAAVLQGIINLAQTTKCGEEDQPAYGAIILFPGHAQVPAPGTDGTDTGMYPGAEYYISCPAGQEYAVLITCDNPLRFLGTGNVKIIMTDAPTGSQLGDIFQLDIAGGNPGGNAFENITFHYPSIDETSNIPQYCAIRSTVGGADNTRVLRCVFEDCPIGIWFSQALQCSIFESTFKYVANAGIAIKLGNTNGEAAKEIYITDCLFNGNNVAHGGMTEPPGSTAIWLLATDHVRVTNAQIDTFQNGVYIAPSTGGNCIRATFTQCAIYTGTDPEYEIGSAVFIQPQVSGGLVSQILFEGCYFEMGDTATPRADVPGILIDAKTNQAIIDTVRFVSCHSLRWPGQGLRILGFVDGNNNIWPANIEVLGGMYSGNRYHDANYSSVDPYGIWIGVATGVRIVGVSCVGSYEYIKLGGGPTTTLTQHVGILVDSGANGVIISGCDVRDNANYGVQIEGGASDVIIDACDVRGNGTNGVLVDGSTSAVKDIYLRNCNATGYSSYSVAINISGVTSNQATIQVTNCAGYNDSAHGLSATPPASRTVFYSYTFGYYGPIEFYVGTAAGVTVTAIAVDSISLHLTTGSFYLVPGESGEVTYSGSSITPWFTAITK